MDAAIRKSARWRDQGMRAYGGRAFTENRAGENAQDMTNVVGDLSVPCWRYEI